MAPRGEIRVLYFDLGGTLVHAGRWLPDARELLATLAARELRLGVLSNTGGLPREKLVSQLPPDLDLALFDPSLVLLSAEIGVEKPDPRAFAIALERAGGAAGCVFVTEDEGHAKAAREAGLASHVVAADGRDLQGLPAALERATGLALPALRAQIRHDRPVEAASLLGAVRAGVAPVEPREVADAYVERFGPLYGMPPAMSRAGLAPDAPRVDHLRVTREKRVGGTVVVSYEQVHQELPVWGTNFTVRLKADENAVTSSAAELDRDLPTTPVALPDSSGLGGAAAPLDPSALGTVLGVAPAGSAFRIHGTRRLVYRFERARREDDEPEGTAEDGREDLPRLPLPALPADLEDGRAYVVDEVLFRCDVEGHPRLNWRAFVEPTRRAALYVRPFVSSCTALVFRTDPVTRANTPLSAGVAALDLLREQVPLAGLGPPVGNPPRQPLRGSYVRLEDRAPPAVSPPTEPAPCAFHYACDTNDFAGANAYYHCDGFYRFMAGLGIDVPGFFSGTTFPVDVDHRGENGQMNAHAYGNATSSGMDRFTFGVAPPIGIAACVRVVIHEFGHALLYDNVRGPNFGFAHSAGDALGAILHDAGSQAPDRFQTFPSIPIARRHDRRVDQGWAWFGPNYNTQYNGEQVLSTTLFRAYRALGGDSAVEADRVWAARFLSYLIISGIGLLTATTRDPRVYVTALRDADANTVAFEGHPGGTAGKLLRWAFEAQGLYGGLPPDVDVYVDDGRNGTYEYRPDPIGSPDVWNRHAPDGGTAHQDPRQGQVNHLYVRVRNRGTTAAHDALVRAYVSDAVEPATWPDDWTPAATPLVPLGPLPAGGSTVSPPLSWMPHSPHAVHVLVAASHPKDPALPELIAPGATLRQDRLLRLDNNIAQSQMDPVHGPTGPVA